MSFFDENIDEIEQVIEEQESSVTSFEPDSLIGSVVYYDPERFKFMVANADGSTFINANNISDWRTIMIGTVIGDNADKTVDVLMCGFLMAEPLYLPRMYHDPSKQKYHGQKNCTPFLRMDAPISAESRQLGFCSICTNH
jgi:hypothetical protein